MKLIIDIPEKIVTAIQNGEDYRYDIHTAIAQDIPYEPKGDLISRSDLIKAIFEHCRSEEENLNHLWYDENLVALINNAPTVEDNEPTLNESIAFNNGYELGKSEKPQGEWEWVQYDANPNIGNWHCSECHYIPQGKKEYQKTNFCPRCGADMRKENDNGKS